MNITFTIKISHKYLALDDILLAKILLYLLLGGPTCNIISYVRYLIIMYKKSCNNNFFDLFFVGGVHHCERTLYGLF